MANELGTWGTISNPYVPSLTGPQFVLPGSAGDNISGVGAPSADPGFTFALYTDTSTGTLYFWNGSVWAAAAGGGGGVGNQSGNGTPIGVKTPASAGQLYVDLTAPYGLWIATGLTNADWSEIVGNV